MNFVGVRYTISNSLDDICAVICAMASLVFPKIFSPNIEVVSKFKPLGKVSLSRIGALVLIDSWI